MAIITARELLNSIASQVQDLTGYDDDTLDDFREELAEIDTLVTTLTDDIDEEN